MGMVAKTTRQMCTLAESEAPSREKGTRVGPGASVWWWMQGWPKQPPVETWKRVHTRRTKPLLFMRIGHDATVRLAHGQKEDSVNMRRRRSVYQISHGVATSSQVKEKWQRVWFIESTLCMWQCGLTLNVFRIGFVHFINIGLLLM